MNRKDLYTALGEMDDDILERSEHKGKKTNKSIWFRWEAIAACFFLFVSMTLTAEATTGAVSNLLAPLFGTTQTEIVDNIGIPVGVSASADGYTLTCDAIIGDRYSVAIVYTLSRDDGQPIPEGVNFGDWTPDIRGSGGAYLSKVTYEDDPSKLYFVMGVKNRAPVIGRLTTVSFAKLEIQDEDGNCTLLANGPWELKFTLRYKDETVKVPVTKREITDAGGEQYRIKNIFLSPVGLHIDARWYNPKSIDGSLLTDDFLVSLLLKDGTTLALENYNKSTIFKAGLKTADYDYTALFDVPVDLDTVQALIICGCEYPVTISS